MVFIVLTVFLCVDEICGFVRNNWYRLRRYIEIELSGAKHSSGAASSVPLGALQLPGNLKGARTAGLSADFDFRGFFLTASRQRLYPNINRRCEVRGGTNKQPESV